MEQACKVRLAICSAGFRCKVHFMRVSKHGLRPRKCPSFSCHRLWTIFRGPIFRQSWQSNICSTVPIFTASLALSQNSLKNIPGIWLDWYSFIGKVLGHPFCSSVSEFSPTLCSQDPQLTSDLEHLQWQMHSRACKTHVRLAATMGLPSAQFMGGSWVFSRDIMGLTKNQI